MEVAIPAETEHIRARCVDSLEKIYAVVIALAISQAIASALRNPVNGTVLEFAQIRLGVPALVAFLATLVPFWHGMNRHLDRCYLEKSPPIAQGALLLDFYAFCIEASVLFVAGWSLRDGIRSFVALGVLLAVDMFWGVISHQIHFRGQKSHVLKWSSINLGAIALAVLVIAYPFQHKIEVLTFIAILRSIVDYSLCWKFYFP